MICNGMFDESQIWPPLSIYDAIFNYGYVLGVKFVVLGFDSFFSNFFQLFYIEIVKFGTNFDNSAKNGPKLQKLVRTKAQKNISSDFALVLRK